MSEITRQTFNLLALSAIERMGIGAQFTLLAKVNLNQELEEIVENLNTAYQPLHLPCGLINPHDLEEAKDFAQREHEKASEQGIKILSILDEDYPECLRYSPYVRPILQIKGPLPKAQAKLVSVVGGAQVTEHGTLITQRICEYLIKEGCQLVSTLTEGCNATVHKCALDADSPSIAILGHGHNFMHPKENDSLAAAIVASGGTIISPFSFYTDAKPKLYGYAFKLLGAISRGTILVQSGVGDLMLNAAHAALVCNHHLGIISPTAYDRQSNFNAVSANLRLCDKNSFHALPTIGLHNLREEGLNYLKKVEIIESKADYEKILSWY